ncbi:MAG: alpha/beta hydrolase [Thiotrichales bacterium]|nr:MAG: alpha/beta hydrolase [Thiotrichales bacterium]
MIYIISLITVYLATVLAFYLFADRIIFNRLHYRSSYQDHDNIIKLANGSVALWLPNKQAQYTIFYCHGNGEDIANIYWLLEELHSRGFAVFALDYRGFGVSRGVPSEKNSYEDVAVAYKYLINSLNLTPSSIIAFGRSLGSGLVVELARTNKIAGVILEGAFVSAYRVMTYWPLLPFDKYKNFQKLLKMPEIPLLILHGTKDSVVPLYHANKLTSLPQASNASLIVPGAGHSDLIQIAGEKYWQAIDKFVDHVNKSSKEIIFVKNSASAKSVVIPLT